MINWIIRHYELWKMSISYEHGSIASAECMDNGKDVRYTSKRVEALERLYHECPQPLSIGLLLLFLLLVENFIRNLL